jgi:hypothetical protein
MVTPEAVAELRLLVPPHDAPRDFALMRTAFVWAMRHLSSRLSEHRHTTSEKALADAAMGIAVEVCGSKWPKGSDAFRDALRAHIVEARAKRGLRLGNREPMIDTSTDEWSRAWRLERAHSAMAKPLIRAAFLHCGYNGDCDPRIDVERKAKPSAGTYRGTWGNPQAPHYELFLPTAWLSRVYLRGLAVVHCPKDGPRFVLDASPVGPIASDRWSVLYVHATRPDRWIDKLAPKQAIAVRQPDGSYLLEKAPRKKKEIPQDGAT